MILSCKEHIWDKKSLGTSALIDGDLHQVRLNRYYRDRTSILFLF